MQLATVGTQTLSSATTESRRKCAVPLSPHVADKLLDLLSTDNEFRRRFKSNPLLALSEITNLPIESAKSVEHSGSCGPVKRIASKQELAAARDQLKMHLTIAGAFTVPHCFEAGKVVSSLRCK